jgi:hypothetical protein
VLAAECHAGLKYAFDVFDHYGAHATRIVRKQDSGLDADIFRGRNLHAEDVVKNLCKYF